MVVDRRDDIGAKVLIGGIGMAISVVGLVIGLYVNSLIGNIGTVTKKAYANETRQVQYEGSTATKIGVLDNKLDNVVQTVGDIKELVQQMIEHTRPGG